MKILMPCVKCSITEGEQALKHKNGIDNYTGNCYYVQINNDGIYEFECINGHKTQSVLGHKKYEVLFESGILAYMDGYYREAISSIVSSLERFLEYCILLMTFNTNFELSSDIETNNEEECEKYGKNVLKLKEEYLKTWKKIRKQSERQLGAYYFLYLCFLKETPEQIDYEIIINNNSKNLRNEVIHNGYIPNQTETFEYIKYIFDYINNVAKKISMKLDKKTFDIVGVMMFEELIEKGLRPGNSLCSISMFLNDIFNCEVSQTFEEKIKSFENNKSTIYGKI